MEAVGATAPDDKVLFDAKTPWKGELYAATDKEVPGTKEKKISGTFMTKIFEGHYRNAGTWAKEMKSFVESKNKKLKKLYFWHTTCPKCAQFYGKNYTVIFAQI